MANNEYPFDWDETDIFEATPIKTSNLRDLVADNKFLIKNLINRLKDIFYQLNIYQIGSSIKFTAEEIQVLTKLFREGACVFRYYKVSGTGSNALGLVVRRYISSSSTREEKELLKAFIAVLEMYLAISYEIFYD